MKTTVCISKYKYYRKAMLEWTGNWKSRWGRWSESCRVCCRTRKVTLSIVLLDTTVLS